MLICSDNPGERGEGKSLPFCKHSNRPAHLCNQPVGRLQHPEERENWDQQPDRLRLRRQRCLQLSLLLPPISLEHTRLSHPLHAQPLPLYTSHILEQAGSSGYCCLPLHHGLPRCLCPEPWRGEEGGLAMLISKLDIDDGVI